MLCVCVLCDARVCVRVCACVCIQCVCVLCAVCVYAVCVVWRSFFLLRSIVSHGFRPHYRATFLIPLSSRLALIAVPAFCCNSSRTEQTRHVFC